MARIRSVHPGFFTDEHFVSCSAFARLLAIGIWTECDDQGIFEWKPITLKMRLMSADAVDVSALLDELVAANLIAKFEHEKRWFGAVRNFMRFQRPKKPKCVHFMPPEFGTYIGLRPSGTEPDEVEDEGVPPKSEMSPQREEGGGRRKESNPVFVPSPEAGEEEKQQLFDIVWKGFPKARTESKPLTIDAFGELSIEEMRGFAANISSIAADIGEMKLDTPYNLAKFIRRKQFQGFIDGAKSSPGPPAGYVHVKPETPEWEAWKAFKGKSPPMDTRGGWHFPTQWPPSHERSTP